jgi:hypothetical protein
VRGSLATVVSLVVGAAFALSPSAARAGLINLTPCTNSALSQPFAPWGDPASYELAPGGDFEQPGWTLAGGAKRVSGSETYKATGTLGQWSLSLPAGSSAESPPICVDAAYPSARFFIAGSGLVAVTIVDGILQIPAGVAIAGGSWEPSPVMLTSSAITGLLAGGTAQVELRITALLGNPRVDDVFVDPWCRG